MTGSKEANTEATNGNGPVPLPASYPLVNQSSRLFSGRLDGDRRYPPALAASAVIHMNQGYDGTGMADKRLLRRVEDNVQLCRKA